MLFGFGKVDQLASRRIRFFTGFTARLGADRLIQVAASRTRQMASCTGLTARARFALAGVVAELLGAREEHPGAAGRRAREDATAMRSGLASWAFTAPRRRRRYQHRVRFAGFAIDTRIQFVARRFTALSGEIRGAAIFRERPKIFGCGTAQRTAAEDCAAAADQAGAAGAARDTDRQRLGVVGARILIQRGFFFEFAVERPDLSAREEDVGEAAGRDDPQILSRYASSPWPRGPMWVIDPSAWVV